MDDADEQHNSAFQTVYSWEALSEEEQERLLEILEDGVQVRAVAYSDMLFSGRYGQSLLVYTGGELLALESGEIRKRVPLVEVESVFCRELVGNGVVEARIDNENRVDLIRYSKTLSEPMQQLADRINRDLGVDADEKEVHEEEVARSAGPKEKKRTHRCPKCGHPLRYPSDPCPQCTSKRKVLGRLCRYLLAHKRLLAIGTLTSFGVVAINLSPPILVRLLIDKALVVDHLPTEVRIRRVYMIVGLFFLMILVRLVVQHTRIRVMGQLAAAVVMDLRRDLFRALQRLSLSYYDQEHTGRIMSRVLSDTRHVQQFVVGGMQRMGVHILMVIGIPVIMLQQHWRLALIALAPIPVAAILGRVFSQRYKRIFRMLKRRMATLSAAVSDAVSGIRVVKSFSQESRETTQFDEKTADIYDAHMSAVGTRALFNPSVMFIMTFGSLVVWFLGGRWVVIGVGGLTTGMLVQFISYMNQLYNPVQQLLQLTEVVQQSTTSAERVFSIMDMPSDVGDHEAAEELTEVNGRIEFHDVSFKYDEGERVLKDITLTVEPGEMIGLVGETGSGKSTLASLVCRFYDPTKGHITLDGKDLRDLKVRSLRQHIGMVLQSTYLFAGTIRDNITYGRPEATEEEIINASKTANAHDFIMGLPDGYDSRVGERGSGLSGGEKQRIAIARAVLKDPAILILDEATSAVDTATEQSIQEAMDRLIHGRTTIAIAHRLSTLRNADKLVVLSDGEMIERGTHEELLEQNGEYAELCKIQAEFAQHVPAGG